MTTQIKKLLVPTVTRKGKAGKTHHIAYTDWGDPNNPHIVICVHGLTRNCRDFDNFAGVLKVDCRVICVDIVGRGQSDWLDNAEDYDHYQLYLSDAASLLEYLQSQYTATIKVDWVGISMGGLIGMMMAIQPNTPVPIRRLVMSDIGPLIPVKALSRMSKYVGKDIFFNSFEECQAYVKQISLPFGSLTEDQWHHLAIHSVHKKKDGTYRFRYDPKVSISFKKHILEDIDLWAQWDMLTTPTLVLRGAESDVLLADTASQMKRRCKKVKIIELPGIGHAPVLLDDKQIEIVKDFLLAPE